MPLISPRELHSSLTSLLNVSSSSSTSNGNGGNVPHTALVIYPTGQLLSAAFTDDTDIDVEQGEEQENGNGNGEEEEEEGEEAYLENQERIRLILGLAVQWSEDDNDKVECELGRILLTPLPLSPTPSTPQHLIQHLPPKSQNINTNNNNNAKTLSLVLVLNGTKDTPWNLLIAKAEEFKKTWKA